MKVVAIHKKQQVAVCDNNTLVPFDVMLDDEGDVTKDVDEAVCVVVSLTDDDFEVLVLSDFEPIRFN